MIHQLLANAGSELIGRLLWEVGALLAQGWSERRAAHSPDLELCVESHRYDAGQRHGTHLAGPRYPGTF